jgi:hypothetical protein
MFLTENKATKEEENKNQEWIDQVSDKLSKIESSTRYAGNRYALTNFIMTSMIKKERRKVSMAIYYEIGRRPK